MSLLTEWEKWLVWRSAQRKTRTVPKWLCPIFKRYKPMSNNYIQNLYTTSILTTHTHTVIIVTTPTHSIPHNNIHVFFCLSYCESPTMYIRLQILNWRDRRGTTAGSHGRLLKRDSTRSHITASSSERMIPLEAIFHCPWSTKEASHTSWLRRMLADMNSLELTESLIHSLNWWISTWPTQSRVIHVTN